MGKVNSGTHCVTLCMHKNVTIHCRKSENNFTEIDISKIKRNLHIFTKFLQLLPHHEN